MSIALVRNPGDGTTYRYYNTVQEQVVSDAETEGVVTALRLTVRKADAPPLHAHSHEDESWVVLAGRVRFWAGSTSLAECEVHDAGPGAYVFGPRHVPHTFQPLTETAEVLVINNPGAIEGYFHAIGPAAERQDTDHEALLAEYGITLLDTAPPA